MKTLEQNYPQEDKMEKSTEGKEALLPIIEILKQTKKKFNSLYKEAYDAIGEQDTKTYREKLAERAELIRDLPGKLTKDLAVIHQEIKKEIESRVQIFADKAQELLKSKDKRVLFALESLLNHKSTGGENDLEELIADLEN